MKELISYLKLALLGAVSGIVLNLIISLSGLSGIFPGYADNAAPVLYSLPVWQGLIMYGAVMPLLEEAVFRLLIFGLMRRHFSFPVCASVSSVCFGIYHMNAVQGIYAFIMGLLLAYVFEKDRRLRVPFIVHSAANIAVYSLSVSCISGIF